MQRQEDTGFLFKWRGSKAVCAPAFGPITRELTNRIRSRLAVERREAAADKRRAALLSEPLPEWWGR